ncbi:MAG: hypothetical protein WC641_05955 [Patescibacteria group bacterium]
MGDKYRTEYKSGGEFGIVPRVEYVIDKETGERKGEVVRWDYENAGDKIADGDWDPYDDDDD